LRGHAGRLESKNARRERTPGSFSYRDEPAMRAASVNSILPKSLGSSDTALPVILDHWVIQYGRKAL
jgi:hypothetical protein